MAKRDRAASVAARSRTTEIVLGMGSHRISRPAGTNRRRLPVQAGVATNILDAARASIAAIARLTAPRALWRSDWRRRIGYATSWNITVMLLLWRRRSSIRHSGTFIAFIPNA